MSFFCCRSRRKPGLEPSTIDRDDAGDKPVSTLSGVPFPVIGFGCNEHGQLGPWTRGESTGELTIPRPRGEPGSPTGSTSRGPAHLVGHITRRGSSSSSGGGFDSPDRSLHGVAKTPRSGRGELRPQHTPVAVPAGNERPISVACGDRALFLVTDEGSVVFRGRTLRFPEGVFVTKAAAGATHALFLTRSGGVYAYGSGSQGQLGLGSDVGDTGGVPVLVTALRGVPVRSVACGASHSLAATESGEVWAWGAGATGQLGILNDTDHGGQQGQQKHNQQNQKQGGENGGLDSLGARQGASRRKLPAAYGHGARPPANEWLPTRVPFFGPGSKPSNGSASSIVSSVSSTVSSTNSASSSSSSSSTVAGSISSSSSSSSSDAATDSSSSSSGSSGGFGLVIETPTGSGSAPPRVRASITTGPVLARAVFAAGNHSHAIDVNGRLYSWGHDGGHGHLGLRDPFALKSSAFLPTPLPPSPVLPPIKTVAAGPRHTIILCTNGTAYGFGNGESGATGAGCASRGPVPKVVRIHHPHHTTTQGSTRHEWSTGRDHPSPSRLAGPTPSSPRGPGWGTRLGNPSAVSSSSSSASSSGPPSPAASTSSRANATNLHRITTNANANLGNAHLNAASGDSPTDVLAAACGESFTVLLLGDGSVATCGSGRYGKLGHGDSLARMSATVVECIQGTQIAVVGAGKHYAIAVPEDHEAPLGAAAGRRGSLDFGYGRGDDSPRYSPRGLGASHEARVKGHHGGRRGSAPSVSAPARDGGGSTIPSSSSSSSISSFLKGAWPASGLIERLNAAVPLGRDKKRTPQSDAGEGGNASDVNNNAAGSSTTATTANTTGTGSGLRRSTGDGHSASTGGAPTATTPHDRDVDSIENDGMDDIDGTARRGAGRHSQGRRRNSNDTSDDERFDEDVFEYYSSSGDDDDE